VVSGSEELDPVTLYGYTELKLRVPIMKMTKIALVCVLLGTGRVLLAAGPEQNLEKTFPVAGGGKLIVMADQGSIDVKTTDTDKVEVHVLREAKQATQAQALDLFSNHEVTFTQERNVVSVSARNTKTSNGFSWRGRPYLEVRYLINLPRKFDVELSTSGGDVRVGELDGAATARTSSGAIDLAGATGKIEARNSGGDIEVGAARSDVSARTSSGAIRLRAVGGRVEASNSGGDIRLGDIGGDVVARTSSGAIQLRSTHGAAELSNSGGDISVEEARGEVRAQTSSGQIALRVIQGAVNAKNSGGDVKIESAGGSVTARTSSGAIRIGHVGGKLVEARNSGGDISIGEAAGGVVVETSSGNIRLKSAGGNVEAKNSGGNITLGDLGGEVVAQTSSGNVEIHLAKGQADLKNSGGNISLAEARGAVVATTSSGTIAVGFTKQPTADSRMEVSGGGITLTLPETAALNLDAHSSGGRIVADIPVTITIHGETRTDALQGKINGGGPAMLLRSSSGDIHLKKLVRLLEKEG